MMGEIVYSTLGRHRSELRPYQSEEIARLSTGASRGLFWQPGAGKTATVLHAVADAFAAGRAKRALLVSTPTIIRSTWSSEISEWQDTAHLNYVALTGSAAARAKTLSAALADPSQSIVAIGFDSVHTIVEHAELFDILIIDEASLARNPTSRRFKALIKFAAAAKQRICMTGSPAPNSVTDVFGVVALVDLGEALGRNYSAFLDETTVRWGDKAWQRRERPEAMSAVMTRIRHLCTSIKTDEVASLPSMTRRVVEVELPPDAREIYNRMESEALNSITNQPVHRDACLIKCQQISNGFLYSEDGTARRIHEAKLDAAADIIEREFEEGGSVMVIYNFAADLEALRKRFKRVAVLGGPEATGRPEDLITLWDDEEIDILAINPRAAGHGINLQRNPSCRTQVWLSGTWSIELYEQTVARLWRPGQKNMIEVHVIVAAETIDEAIVRVMDRKQDGQAAIMSALKARAAERSSPDMRTIIREARRAAARAHPDAGGSADAFRAAWEHYQHLISTAL
jgi:superfamily II DNA or RNA helicase